MQSGEIGVFLQDGKQVGGFLDWTIEVRFNSVERPGGRVYQKAQTKATASRYWLLFNPEGKITASYYQLCGDTLALVNSHTVEVNLTGDLDKMINRPIEMIWTN